MSSDGERKDGLPRGPHGLTKTYVERNQRERLLAAIVKAIEQQGYAATSVTDVIERAGVSRKTFYAQFADRRDCLLAAYREASTHVVRQARDAVASAPGERGARALVDSLWEVAAQSPGTARLLAVDIAAAGSEGIAMRQETMAALGAAIGDAVTDDADRRLPPPMLGTLAGTLSRLIDLRHRRRVKRADAEAFRTELTRWLLTYSPAPAAIAKPVECPIAPPPPAGLLGGRAPGTLSVAPSRLTAGIRSVSPSLTAHNQRERVLDAIASLSMEKGYISLTVDEVCAIAGVSLNTFYQHFENKRDAFLVAHEIGYIRGAAIVERSLLDAPRWQEGVTDAIGALLSFLASEPAFAHLAAIQAPIAAPETIVRSTKHLAGYASLLLAGAPKSRKPPSLIEQAIAASLHETAFAWAASGFTEPLAAEGSRFAYIVLAPYLGLQRAAEAANGSATRSGAQAG